MRFTLSVPIIVALLTLAGCDRPAESSESPAAAPSSDELGQVQGEAAEASPPAEQQAPAATGEAAPAAQGAQAAPVYCATAADTFSGDAGTRVTVRCPAGCGQESVWGTDLYSDDSAICAAAIHAGVLSAQEGGTVEFFVATGATHYPPSTRNGVTTLEWPEWGRSFAFPAANPADRPVNATCTTRAQHLPGPAHTVQCPAGCTAGEVWGTDLYSDDSMICAAAIHAGVVPAGQAGTVALTIAPGVPSYAASARHGIQSHEWPAWGRSFRVAAP